jgi:hypothetical protein
MKTIARTLIIILAAGLIALGWTAYAATDSTQSSLPDRPAEFAPADDAAADIDEAPPARPEADELGFSVGRILSGLAVIIGQTTLVIGLVALARKFGNWLISYFRVVKSHRQRLNVPLHPN